MILAQKPSFTKKKYKKEDKELEMEPDYCHSEYTKGWNCFCIQMDPDLPPIWCHRSENDHDKQQHQATMMNATDLLQGNVSRT